MHRRRFLGLAGGIGAVAAAGCSDVLESGDSAPELDPDEMAAVVSEPPPDPARPAPIRPALDVVESGLDRGDSLLGTLPDSFDSVPDEHVRETLERTRERARRAREDVESAPHDFRALLETGAYRRRARTVATAHEALDSDVRAAIERERTDVERAVATELAQVSYAGANRDRTLLLATRLEESLTAAQRALARSYGRHDEVSLTVGQLAGDAEYARALTDAAAHLSAQHDDAVETPLQFTQAFDSALARAETDLTEYVRDDSPTELTDEAGDRREVFLLVDVALVTPQTLRNVNADVQRRHLGLGLDGALELAMEGRALERVLSRVDEGEFPRPETVDRVRAERDAALAAAADADIDPSAQSLAADRYVRTVQWAHLIDESLRESVERAREEGRGVNPALPYAQYATLRARLASLPEAVDDLERWLDR